MVETIKNNVLKEYFLIGILEEFELSLKLMEMMLPEYMTGIVEIYKSPIGQGATINSSTSYNYTVSDQTRKYLAKGPMKHSVDVYNFIKALFWQKVKAHGLYESS